MIMHLMDEFRCGESFAAEYLSKWVDVSDQECVKGGLRVVQQREAYHAQILEARLRELGGVPQCTVPQERREKELPFYGSTEKKDAEKLLSIASRIGDPATVLKPLTDAIAQIQEDQQSKELLRSLVADEMSSITWLMEACRTLNAPQTA
jgi:bacterioferritin (cytochrome b1)